MFLLLLSVQSSCPLLIDSHELSAVMTKHLTSLYSSPTITTHRITTTATATTSTDLEQEHAEGTQLTQGINGALSSDLHVSPYDATMMSRNNVIASNDVDLLTRREMMKPVAALFLCATVFDACCHNDNLRLSYLRVRDVCSDNTKLDACVNKTGLDICSGLNGRGNENGQGSGLDGRVNEIGLVVGTVDREDRGSSKEDKVGSYVAGVEGQLEKLGVGRGLVDNDGVKGQETVDIMEERRKCQNEGNVCREHGEEGDDFRDGEVESVYSCCSKSLLTRQSRPSLLVQRQKSVAELNGTLSHNERVHGNDTMAQIATTCVDNSGTIAHLDTSSTSRNNDKIARLEQPTENCSKNKMADVLLADEDFIRSFHHFLLNQFISVSCGLYAV